MSITASFNSNAGTLNITADAFDNNVILSRTAAGALLVNGGAVAIAGVAPTVNNAFLTVINGLDGNDNLTLSEANGLLQAAQFHGGGADIQCERLRSHAIETNAGAVGRRDKRLVVIAAVHFGGVGSVATFEEVAVIAVIPHHAVIAILAEGRQRHHQWRQRGRPSAGGRRQ